MERKGRGIFQYFFFISTPSRHECISFSCFVPLVLAGCNELSVRKPSILRFSEPNQTLTKGQRQFAATLSHDCQLFSNSSWRIARRRCIVDCRIMGEGSSTTICRAVLPLFCPACYQVHRLLSLNAAKFHSQPLEQPPTVFAPLPWRTVERIAIASKVQRVQDAATARSCAPIMCPSSCASLCKAQQIA